MSIEQIISNDADNASPEVKAKANEEPNSEMWRSKRLDNDIKEQDMFERKLYAYRVFALICIWLGCVMLVVFATGKGDLHYSDTVMVTLLTTTTANVIGLFAIVNNYLFKTKK